MAGHSGWNVAITAISLVVNVSLNLALIPRYGIAGAAAAWAVTFFVDNFLSTMILHRLNHLDPFGRGYLVATTAAFGCFGVLGLLARAVAGATATGLLLFAAIAVPLYLVILWKNREALRLEVLIQMVRRRGAVTSEAPSAAPAEP